MKNKPNDIPYLKCNINKIKNANPRLNMESLEILYNYIIDRQEIYTKRESNQKPPWSESEIFQKYSFTNVRRELDSTTKWVINNICNNPKLSYADRFYRTILFRIYNKIDTAKSINLNMDSISFWTDSNFSRAVEKIEGHAYGLDYSVVSIISNMKEKYPDNNYKINPMFHIKQLFIQNEFKIPYKVEDNAEETIKWLKNNIPGVGDFIAYQIFIDLTYIDEFPISENEFTICGPGCKRGLNYLFDDKDGMSYTECIFWLRDNQNKIFKDINSSFSFQELFKNLSEYNRDWNVMSIENCMCELQKYINIINGKKKLPNKNRYS